MKKTLIILLVVCLLIAVGCKKDPTVKMWEVNSEAELMKAMKEGGEILIAKDFEVMRPVFVYSDAKLDLNGKTITYSGDDNERLFTILNNVSLEVKGKGKIVSTTEKSLGLFNVYGNLVIHDGTYESSGISKGHIIRGLKGSNIVVNDGTISAKRFDAALHSDGVVVINGGLFESHAYNNTTAAGLKEKYTYTVISKGEITVNGGVIRGIHGALAVINAKGTVNNVKAYTFVTPMDGISSPDSYYALYVAGEVGKVDVTVKNGTFISEKQAAVLVGNSNDGGEKEKASLTLLGGTFESKALTYDFKYSEETKGSIDIMGGTFKHDEALNMDSGGGKVKLSTLINKDYELKAVEGGFKVQKKQ